MEGIEDWRIINKMRNRKLSEEKERERNECL